jgi:hypothetical protein
MSIIIAALKSLLPSLITKAVEVATSKKAWATAAAYLGVQTSSDWKQQAATAVVGAAYVLAQGNIDAKKVAAAK